MPEKIVKKRNYMYIGIIILLLIVIAVLVGQTGIIGGSTDKANENSPAVMTVKDIYSIVTENPVKVLKVDEESGLYRIVMITTLPNGQQNVAEAFVTKDGLMIVTNPLNTTGYVDQLKREKAFAECLAGKKVMIAGQSTDANTVQQLRLVGSFAYKVYIDCGGANLNLCQQAGITQIPVTVYNNASYVGVQTLSFFEGLTDCRY